MDIVFDSISIDIWPVGIVALVAILAFLFRRKQRLAYLLFFSVFWIYILFVLKETLFPIQVAGGYVEAMRQVPFLSHVNLVPLYFGRFGLSSGILVGIAKNILLTVPCGFGINFISRLRARDFLWLAVAVGLGIETVQLVISLLLRYPYRVIDINDALFNTIGVWVGYGLFRVFAWLYLALARRFEIEYFGLAAYLLDVVNQTQTEQVLLEQK